MGGKASCAALRRAALLVALCCVWQKHTAVQQCVYCPPAASRAHLRAALPSARLPACVSIAQLQMGGIPYGMAYGQQGTGMHASMPPAYYGGGLN